MPRKAQGLSAQTVKNAPPGRHGDGRGLYLMVRPNGARYWTFRWMKFGKAREAGLGPASGRYAVTLSQAREAAQKMHDQLRAGIDPLAEKAAKREARKAEAAIKAIKGKTFKQVADQYVEMHETSDDPDDEPWSDSHRQTVVNSLRKFAYPVIGDIPVGDITSAHVFKIIDPIWKSKQQTAARLRTRIAAIWDYARAKKLVHGDNPAALLWIKDGLPNKAKLRKVKHHAAVPWKQLPSFMAELRATDSTASRCLEFIVLTAARSGEAREAVWSEIDFKERTWTIPKDRMKTRIEHRVALSNAAIAVLEAVMPQKVDTSAFVFPGARKGRPISDMTVAERVPEATVHGFRSTFRDWVAENTNYQRELAEAALAHTIGGVEGAYQRGPMLEKRRIMMQAWADYCEKREGVVIQLKEAKVK